MASLFLLSALPFLYLTLLPSGASEGSDERTQDSNIAPVEPSLTTEKENANQNNGAPQYDIVPKPKVVTFLPESLQTERQKAVVEACKHAWMGYEKFAWGKDELLPLSRSSHTWFNLGLTLVDSLDTLWIMDMQKEFEKATKWIEDSFTADVSKDVNLFETTIRVLGGLLSAYDLSGNSIFKQKALDLGERLVYAFGSKSPIPYSDVNLHSLVAKVPKWGPDSSTSEVTSIQLEFKELSRVTNKDIFKEKALAVSSHVKKLDKVRGLVPYFINANSGKFRPGTLTLGARADSYYEYLLKQYIQTNYTEPSFKHEFEAAVDGISSLLTKETSNNHLWIVGELVPTSNKFSAKMDHLVCFYPGLLALASVHGFEPKDRYMALAENITRTCYEMYRAQPTGLAPEISHFVMEAVDKDAGNALNPEAKDTDLFVKPLDKHYLLRPETVESLFYLYRITGDSKYQEWGWKIFESIEKYTKVATGGYSSINNVLDPQNPQPKDKMESFFIGETLKYLFLLFDDSKSLLPLDKYVFNTEAHPFPIFTP